MRDDVTERRAQEGQEKSPSAPADPPSPLAPRPSPLLPHLIFLAIWLILLIAGRSAMFRDPGAFWHVVSGEKMLAAGQVIREDPYSFTRAGKPWVAHQWLAECGMAAIHDLAGWDGLLLVSVTVLAGVYAWIAARLLRSGAHVILAVLLVAMAMMLGSPQFHVRPLVLTIALLAVTFAWLVDVEAGSRRPRQLWWLVPMFVFWTNVHGGMLSGLGTAAVCLGGWCAVAILDTWRNRNTTNNWNSRRHRVWRLLFESTALVLALMATTMVSPYGWALPQEWLDTLTMPLSEVIEEHARLDLAEPVAWITLALGGFYLATLVGVWPRRPRITWLVPLIWFALSISRVRNAPLFGVTAAIALADMLPCSRVGDWLRQRGWLAAVQARPLPPSPLAKGEGRWSAVAVLVPAVIVAAAFALQIGGIRVPVVGSGWARFDSTRWPVELLPRLREIDRSSAEGTRIFNDLNFGGFLIYHTPRLRIFVDDRCPLYGTEFLLDYTRARREDPAQIDRWQRQYGFSYALVEAGGRFDGFLRDSREWALVDRSPAAALYRHEQWAGRE
jgi:hypothetical protein